jgi:hypothetical protein
MYCSALHVKYDMHMDPAQAGDRQIGMSVGLKLLAHPRYQSPHIPTAMRTLDSSGRQGRFRKYGSDVIQSALYALGWVWRSSKIDRLVLASQLGGMTTPERKNPLLLYPISDSTRASQALSLIMAS